MVATALAVAGVVGALSLAGIFIVYLVDTIGGDDSNEPAQVQPRTTGATGATGVPDGTSGPTGAPGSEVPGGLPEGPTGFNPKLNRIPDNQQFENFKNTSAGYSIDFPKGWNSSGEGDDVTWSIGKNSERVTLVRTAVQTPKDIKAAYRSNKSARIVLSPRYVRLGSLRPIKLTFQQVGATNEQGAAIRIFVDQYKFYRGGKVATLDLVTTGAVRRDNADEFDRISRSFRWS